MCTLDEKEEPPRPHTVTWMGRDEQGGVVAPGIYLVRVEVNTDISRFARARSVAGPG